jgi:hypothetical protein
MRRPTATVPAFDLCDVRDTHARCNDQVAHVFETAELADQAHREARIVLVIRRR